MRITRLLLVIIGLSLLLTPLSSVNAAPHNSITVQALFQQYKSGFMVWRGDSGDIWVFAYDGRAIRFASTTYGLLPENPVRQRPHAGSFRPRLGFGKVWGNYPYVRAALGWPLQPEVGYTMQLDYLNQFNFNINLPDNRLVNVAHFTQWQFAGMTPGNTLAAFQVFDNGYMIWRADTQEVMIFIGTANGSLQGVSVGNYGRWLDSPVTDNPPPGHVKPINAFGRIWGNLPEVRQQIGWPTRAEQGYRTTYQAANNGQFNISAPDGRVFKIYGVSWTF